MQLRVSFMAALAVVLLTLNSCFTSALYNEYAYRNTISLKVEALSLMDKATGDYSNHEEKVEDLLNETRKLYEYDKGRERNELTVSMWETMLNPDKNLLGGFLEKWEQDGQLSPFLVKESSKQVERAFDLIIGLELEKIKEDEVNEFLK